MTTNRKSLSIQYNNCGNLYRNVGTYLTTLPLDTFLTPVKTGYGDHKNCICLFEKNHKQVTKHEFIKC